MAFEREVQDIGTKAFYANNMRSQLDIIDTYKLESNNDKSIAASCPQKSFVNKCCNQVEIVFFSILSN